MVRHLVLVAVLGFVFVTGCSSSKSSSDAASTSDAGKDAAKDTAAVDAPSDDAAASDTVPGPSSDASGDAVADAGADAQVLTAQQMRGKYLVNNVVGCPDCHTPRDMTGAPIFSKFLSGAECFIKLPNGHCLHTRNLTNDETGLKNRTDLEIKRMFQDGIRTAAAKDEPLNPVMPYYVFHNMKAEDADSIVAYLRTVPAVVHQVPRRDVEFDLPAAAPPLDPATIPTPADNDPNKDSALRGRYLATEAGVCIECHTKKNAPGSATVMDPANFFAGGEEFPLGIPGDPDPISRNITSDKDTGIGNWTVQNILTVLRMGKDDQGKQLCPPMPFGPMGAYAGLTDDDATDIANYIKTVPAKTNKVASMCVWPPMAPPATDAGSDAVTSAADAGADAVSAD